MKKSLLLATGLAVCISQIASAVVKDPATYSPAAGLTCENVWLTGLTPDFDGWKALDFASASKARTATIYGDRVIVSVSANLPDPSDPEGGLIDQAHFYYFDLATGEQIKSVQITCDGEPVKGLLCANQVGVDDFGHVWFIGLNSDASKNPVKIYHVTDLENGLATIEAELLVNEEEADYCSRHDYYDIVGDITRQEARCVVMTPVAFPADVQGKNMDKTVIGWECEQGSDEWGPHMCGGEYYCGIMEETYPEGNLHWNGAPMVYIVRDEDYSGEYFYVDPFNGYPTLYNQEGAKIDDMSVCPDMTDKINGIQQGSNGVTEFTVGGVDLLAYGHSDYTGSAGCRFGIAKLGENKEFEGMEMLWTLPEAGFGAISDGGSRIVPVKAVVEADANGKEGAYVLAYKSMNGMGVYRVAEEGWNDVIGGVGEIVASATGEVHYFNLQGQRVAADNLVNGIYVTRQGSKTSKVVIR